MSFDDTIRKVSLSKLDPRNSSYGSQTESLMKRSRGGVGDGVGDGVVEHLFNSHTLVPLIQCHFLNASGPIVFQLWTMGYSMVCLTWQTLLSLKMNFFDDTIWKVSFSFQEILKSLKLDSIYGS